MFDFYLFINSVLASPVPVETNESVTRPITTYCYIFVSVSYYPIAVELQGKNVIIIIKIMHKT